MRSAMSQPAGRSSSPGPATPSTPARAEVPAPELWGRGQPWRHGTVRGRVYGPLPDELAERVARWLEAGPTDELERLKPPCVFRRDSLVVKFFPRSSALGRLRPTRAVRAAELYFRCLPVPSPRPLLAAGGGGGRASLLLREHLEGELLTTAWRGNERAARELVPFLARMHTNGVLHGDLHPANLIWTGADWRLLDVEGVRHRLHSAPRVIEGQWARLLAHLDDEPGLERAYGTYRELVGLAGGAGRSDAWRRIRAQASRLALQFRSLPSWAEAGRP